MHCLSVYQIFLLNDLDFTSSFLHRCLNDCINKLLPSSDSCRHLCSAVSSVTIGNSVVIEVVIYPQSDAFIEYRTSAHPSRCDVGSVLDGVLYDQSVSVNTVQSKATLLLFNSGPSTFFGNPSLSSLHKR